MNHCNNPQTSLPLGISQKPPTLPKVTRSLKQGSRHAVHCSDTSNSSPIIFHMEEGLLTLAPGALQFITASSPSTNLPLVPACALYPWTIHCHICLLFHLLLRFPCNSISPPISLSWQNLNAPPNSSKRALLIYFLSFSHVAWHVESSFPNHGSNSQPQHWKCRVLTTGLPGTSLKGPFLIEDFHDPCSLILSITEFLPNHTGFISISELPSKPCNTKP